MNSSSQTLNFFKILIVANFLLSFALQTRAQNCDTTNIVKYYLDQEHNEGWQIVNHQQNGYYLVSSADNRIIISKFGENGMLAWSDAIDLDPTQSEKVNFATLDSNFNIIGCGRAPRSGGVPDIGFIFKYNPQERQLAWAKYLRSSQPKFFEFKESADNKSYTLITEEDCDATYFEIDKENGEILLQKSFSSGNCELFRSIIMHNEFKYLSGRFTIDGGSADYMRSTLVKLDNDKNIVWAKYYLNPTNSSARVYSIKNILSNNSNSIIVAGHGDRNGTSTSNVDLHIYECDFDGNLIWAKYYDIDNANYEKVNACVKDGEFYYLSGNYNDNSNNFLLKIDNTGNIIWAKEIVMNSNTTINDIQISSSNIIVTGKTNESFNKSIVVKLDKDGNETTKCITIKDLVVSIENADLYSKDFSPDIFSKNYALQNYENSNEEFVLTEKSNCDIVCTEICDNEIDDDNNGLTDCQDPKCSNNEVCNNQNNCASDYFRAELNFGDNSEGFVLLDNEQSGYYIISSKKDSIIISEFNYDDSNINNYGIYTNSFIAIELSAILDSENNIVMAGRADVPETFILKYAPNENRVLWFKKLNTGNYDYFRDIKEIEAGGNYMLGGDFAIALNDQDLMLSILDRNTGDIQTQSNFDNLHVDRIFQLEIYNNEIYAIGSNVLGNRYELASRSTLSKFDINGNIIYSHAYINADVYETRSNGMDIIIEDDKVYTISVADRNGGTVSNVTVVVIKTDLNGNVIEEIELDLIKSSCIKIDEFIKVNSNFIFVGYANWGETPSWQNPRRGFIVRTNENFEVLNAYRINYGEGWWSSINDVKEINSSIYCVGRAVNENTLFMKFDLNLTTPDTCYLKPIDVIRTKIEQPKQIPFQYNPVNFTSNFTNFTTESSLRAPVEFQNKCSVQFEPDLITYTGCKGDGYTYTSPNGNLYDENNPLGEESVVDLTGCHYNLNVNLSFISPKDDISITYEGCQGDEYSYTGPNGIIYNQTNPFANEVLQDENGCNYNLLVDLVFHSMKPDITHEYTGCTGDGYSFSSPSGQLYNENNPNGNEILQDENGCKYNLSVDLNFTDTENINENYMGCSGDGYSYISPNGIEYNQANPTGTEMVTVADNCQYTLTVGLEFFEPYYNNVVEEVCLGEFIELFGERLTHGDEKQFSFINQNGCDSVVNVSVLSHQAIEIYVDTLFSIAYGESLKIEVLTNLNNAQILWYQNQNLSCDTCFQSIFSGYENEVLNFVVKDLDTGCTIDSSISVIVETPEIYIPSAFSPNGDGQNDYFEIRDQKNLNSFLLRIYNRYGEKVFESENINEKWDGTYKGKIQEIGVFVYYMIAEDINNVKTKTKGNITLIR